METFQPTQLSWLSRLLLHPAIHVTSIIVLVTIAVVYIKTKNRESQNFLAQVERIQSGPVVIEKSETQVAELVPDQTVNESTLAAADPNLKMPTSAEPTSKVGFVGGSAASSLTGSESSATEATPTNAATPAGAAAAPALLPPQKVPAAKSGLKVRVLYTEIDIATLESWSQKMQASGQYSQSDFRMGVLPNIAKEISSDRSLVVMDKVEKAFETGSQQQWFVGRGAEQPSRGPALGFNTTLMLTTSDRDGLRGELKVVRKIDPTDPRTFEAEFEIGPGAGWVFSDILTRQYRLEPQEEMNPSSFFRIFNSRRFMNSRTQFAMLFIFDRSGSK